MAMVKGLDLRAYEIVIVDDGSTDGTGAIADDLAARHPHVRVVHHGGNRGYGAALKSGFGEATLEWVFYSDSDGQFDLKDIDRLLPHVDANDAILGYRVRRADHAVRRLNQGLWTALVRALFRLEVRDVDCAFKLIRRRELQRMGPLVSEGAVVSTELLVKLQKGGARMVQVGVSHRPRTAGRPSGNHPRVIARALRELVTLRRVLRDWSPQPGAAVVGRQST
jgi:glycosyltransferase involved in cell wall biosynthesis